MFTNDVKLQLVDNIKGMVLRQGYMQRLREMYRCMWLKNVSSKRAFCGKWRTFFSGQVVS